MKNKKYFQDVFINYAPGDNGGAIGAALVVAHKYFDKIDNLKTPYLGSEYNDHEIKETLENNTYKKNLSTDIIKMMMNFLSLLQS